MIVLTTAKDNTANNGTTAKLVDLWREGGDDVIPLEFEPSLDIPHNSVDPAADPVKKQVVYEQIRRLLGQQGDVSE